MKFPMVPVSSLVGAFVCARNLTAKYVPVVVEAVGTAICEAAFVATYCVARVVEATPGAIARAKEVLLPVAAAARARVSKAIEATPGAVAKARESARTYCVAAYERTMAFYAVAKEFSADCGFQFFRTEKFGKVE